MNKTPYKSFSLKAAIELAAPPTWAASIMSVAVGAASAVTLSFEFFFDWDLRSVVVLALMLVTAVLLQSAVNALNDYKDFLAGADTSATVYDITDASIVYNHIDPKDALRLSIVLMMAAATTGIVVVFLSGWPLLIIGLVGGVIVVLYSVGPRPISYLPLGELVSGLTMGGLITIATFYALTINFAPSAALMTIPPIITIAMIMLTNNTCDIERDIEVGRKTLPIILGRAQSMRLAQMLAWCTLSFMVIFSVVLDIMIWRSMIVLVVNTALAVVLYFLFRGYVAKIANGPYNLRYRRMAMQNVVSFCYVSNLVWCVMLLLNWGLGEKLALS